MSLALPRPDNLRGRFGVLVDSDVYHIAERIQQIDKRLYIHALDPPVQLPGLPPYNFAICELCSDGVERLVFRVEALDARVIQRLERILAVPLERRRKEAERVEEAWKQEHKEREQEELYERMGRPMLTDLERCGFIQRSVSYPKRGVKAA